MNIIIMSLFAGVVGMGLGGIITAIFGNRTEKMISIFLSLAGGVMLSIVFIELIPEAIEYSNAGIAIIGLIIGALMVMALNNVMDRVSKTKKNSSGSESKLHETYAEFFHSSELISNEKAAPAARFVQSNLLANKKAAVPLSIGSKGRTLPERKKGLIRSGMIMLFAIALHNIPEGLAMGAAGYHDAALGLTLAIMIGLHNIPEGMAISTPLISGGLSRLKTVLLVMLTGATTLIGTIAGLLIGGVSDIALALSFSIAGGAMLYVVFGEILPQSIVTNKDRMPAVFALVGIIVGLLITQI